MHNWSDKSVDWKGIGDAARWIGAFCVRWGRINVRDCKEKWGTVRVYCDFGWYGLLSITHPRWHHYGPYPRWLRRLDIYVIPGLIRRSGLNRPVRWWQRVVYRTAYRLALRKWPHLRAEILDAADHAECLEGL